MWLDSETGRDFPCLSSVANTVAEILVQELSRPISIGVSRGLGRRQIADDRADAGRVSEALAMNASPTVVKWVPPFVISNGTARRKS